MKHEVDFWVHSISSRHRNRTKPHDEVSMSTNPVPPADSPPTSYSARISSLIQPTTTATEIVRDEGTRSKTMMIGKAEGTANTNWHYTPFPLPSDDSTRTFDRHARDGRPSPYLTRRCPACFSAPGAKLSHSRYVIQTLWRWLIRRITYSARAIVCLDANFSQRRRHSKYKDPSLLHPDTYWISPEDVKKMEVDVETTRTGTKQRAANDTCTSTEVQDIPENVKKTEVGVEAARTGTKQRAANDTCTSTEVQDIPEEVYDNCKKMFVAAQNISKASNKIFADTAIMALVCRHDCPLFLVNMTSPGERQHYALALLHEFFRQLPNDWDIGLLYDIACQLRRSMQKVCVIFFIRGVQCSNVNWL